MPTSPPTVAPSNSPTTAGYIPVLSSYPVGTLPTVPIAGGSCGSDYFNTDGMVMKMSDYDESSALFDSSGLAFWYNGVNYANSLYWSANFEFGLGSSLDSYNAAGTAGQNAIHLGSYDKYITV